MTRPVILLTGRGGQVGWELERSLAPLGDVVALARGALDLSDVAQIREVVRAVKPALIVNPAAYTAVDKAESDADLAHAINAIAPAVLAEEAKRLGAALIHYSTDYVFDGGKAAPYLETDKPNPLNVYGASKLAGEAALAASGIDYLCFRTSWVYGARGGNFMRTILRLAQERDELKIVADQVGAPTWSRMISDATAAVLAQRWLPAGGRLVEVSGLYHLTAAGETSWHGFAQAVLDEVAGLPEWAGRKLARVLPIPTSGYPLPAPRSPYSVLSNDKLQATFGLSLPDWRVSLKQVIASLSA
ncbi:dTDP-4-dehydrorhamnose reductase [Chitinivorax sp. PXF-14]|uniref:dTDP-4-dehydrorhamnose reductase n=1 Tax=Chitinivorax sp. PXF-14 TaxID=3230488 RepID=UPI003467364E